MQSRYKRTGWYREPERHSLSARGISTGRKTNFLYITPSSSIILYAKLNLMRWGDVSYFKEKDIPSNLLKYKNMLIHFTDKKNIESIRKNGFSLSKNPNILKGVYTFPFATYGEDDFLTNKDKAHFLIEVDKDAVYYDTGAHYPSDAMYGFGSKNYRDLYIESMIGLDEKNSILKKYNAGSKGWHNIVNKIMDDKDKRHRFNDILIDKLNQQGIDILQHGGEVIILNPNVIKKYKLFPKDMQQKILQSAPEEENDYLAVNIGGKRLNFKSPIVT
jgi:hypothetical protein